MKLIAILLVSIVLASCSFLPEREVTVRAETTIVCDKPPRAAPFVARETKPTVIEIEGEALVAYTPKDYENMSLMLQSLLKHLRQKNAIVAYYRGCIERTRGDNTNGDTQS